MWERRVQPRSAVERSEGTRLTALRNDKQETLLVKSKQSFALLTSNLICAVPTTSRVSGSSWRRGCEVLISQAAVSQPLRVFVQIDLFLAEDLDVGRGLVWPGTKVPKASMSRPAARWPGGDRRKRRPASHEAGTGTHLAKCWL